MWSPKFQKICVETWHGTFEKNQSQGPAVCKYSKQYPLLDRKKKDDYASLD